MGDNSEKMLEEKCQLRSSSVTVIVSFLLFIPSPHHSHFSGI